jgi:glycosyltransferase involved in cell wall biosynthesis
VYPSFYEGFGLPVVEAMSLSCCVITANNSSLSEVAGEAAILIDSGSISELCMAMEEVYLDEKLRADLKQKGREQLKRFDTKHQLEILERLLLAINAV